MPRFSEAPFAIDAKHELALLVYKLSGVVLSSHPDYFCLSERKGCAISYKGSQCVFESAVSPEDMFVAVKTFSGNHDMRLPVIKSTWGSSLPHIVYFSDKASDNIPTVDSGVPNTERGMNLSLLKILNPLMVTLLRAYHATSASALKDLVSRGNAWELLDTGLGFMSLFDSLVNGSCYGRVSAQISASS
ncbi:hypothetical protein KIN20_011332 [Parelaphostrongylus tenuis]|uniref:Fringe-like glycosyltransferase domain-containing protein n=1 Tax=Parelaphostrongylus tenuis TaxID=148309 RepID=A0AAD5QKY6_PARTN|nr:hypothetical protein KIN20_011332 [Parelaphostrongylus tenuis]